MLPLPQNVDEEQIQCDFQDGVLKLHLPKVEQPQPRGRRIPIGDGASRPASLEAHAETDTGTTGAAPTAQAAEGLENNAAESGKQSRTTRSRGKGKEEAGAA